MTINSVGDLASSLLARRNNSALKGKFQILAQELSTGRKADIAKELAGNTSQLNALEHSLRAIDAYKGAQTTLEQKLNHAEIALGSISDVLSGIGTSALANVGAGPVAVDRAVIGAEDRFEAVISSLSVRAGGTFVFSGTSSQTAPLNDSTTILTALEAATAGDMTASDFSQSIEDWFAQPGGFDVVGYVGGDAPVNGVGVSPTTELTFELTAEAEEIRDVLKDLAVFALMEREALSGFPDERDTLLATAAQGVMQSENVLIGIRAELGLLQSQVSDARAENSAQENAMSKMKSDLVSVDLFETASRFEEVQLQLESFYLATSKTARLSLTGFLR
ncbi:MAG: flagellin [Pseudomonadota bacterium]